MTNLVELLAGQIDRKVQIGIKVREVKKGVNWELAALCHPGSFLGSALGPGSLQPNPHRGPLTFKDHLHKVLSGQLVLAHKALVRAPVTFDHVIHDKVFVVDPCDPHIFPRVKDFAVSVPGELLVLTCGHAAGQGHLAPHAALHLPGADGGFQWL